MDIKAPVLDNRTSEEIYREALELARSYCPELTIPDDPNYFDPDDPSLVILKLFSKMTEFLINQMNRIPDKHSLAFFDFMGLDLLAARPARVPLTFNLAEGSSGTFVPSGTAIASSEDPEVVFETTNGLNVSPARFDAVFSSNPRENRYTDHSIAVSGEEDGFRIFGKGVNEESLDYIIYLGDDILFDVRTKPTTSEIHFKGSNLIKNVIDFDIQKVEKSSIDGNDSFWLAVKPLENGLINEKKKLSTISDITANITVEQIIPDAAFFNDTPIDTKKGFYPFGEEPKKGDTLYIGSEEAFSKEGAVITLDIKFENTTSFCDKKLQWEYWMGSEWVELETKCPENTTNKIIFTCPPKDSELPLKPVEINGQLNRWIRVRIIGEEVYGTAGELTQISVDEIFEKLDDELKDCKTIIQQKLNSIGVSFGFKYIKPKFNPPFIVSLNISYSYSGKNPDKIKIFKKFQYENIKKPYKLVPYETENGMPALYLGFKENISNTPITLFFALKEKRYTDEEEIIHWGNKDQNEQGEASGLTWKYSRGDNKWVEFGVEDETDFFRTNGIVSFIVPSDITKTFEFGKELYWIKTEIKDGNWVSCPKLKGIFPNTIWALNSVTVENEVLGSGNGEPGLSLFFSKKPVLEEQVIEVKEEGIPSKDELKVIESDTDRDVLRIEEESGDVKVVWVKWQEVRDFAFSGPLSRHYILDRTNGKLTFGDGIRGMIPPKGKNNIVASLYRSGGGKRGNVRLGTVTSLKTTIPNIESVANHIPSSGGMDQENSESVVNRGPYTIKNRNRAVTKEDFEWLAKEASQYVAKARCIAENGKIKVVIVPKYEYDEPLPEAGLLDTVEGYLKERAFATILNRIEVMGPIYKKIDVNVTFKPVSIAEGIVVSDRIKERLKVFLHPLKGGQKSQGWNFGQDIYISEIASVIEAIDGVDYVKELELKKKVKAASGAEELEIISVSGVGQMEIGSNELPSSGNIEVKINSEN